MKFIEIAREVFAKKQAYLFREVEEGSRVYDMKPWDGKRTRGWTFLDLFSASAYKTVYDHPTLTDENRARLDKLHPVKAISICFKMCK